MILSSIFFFIIIITIIIIIIIIIIITILLDAGFHFGAGFAHLYLLSRVSVDTR